MNDIYEWGRGNRPCGWGETPLNPKRSYLSTPKVKASNLKDQKASFLKRAIIRFWASSHVT